MRTVDRAVALAAPAMADELAKSVGYRAAVLRLVLERDLAYDGALVPPAEAQRLASAFIAHVGNDAE